MKEEYKKVLDLIDSHFVNADKKDAPYIKTYIKVSNSALTMLKNAVLELANEE